MKFFLAKTVVLMAFALLLLQGYGSARRLVSARILRYDFSTQMLELMSEGSVPRGNRFVVFKHNVELGILFSPKKFGGELFGRFSPSEYFRKLKNVQGIEVTLAARH
jgi:hypothetical protein